MISAEFPNETKDSDNKHGNYIATCKYGHPSQLKEKKRKKHTDIELDEQCQLKQWNVCIHSTEKMKLGIQILSAV